MRIIHPDDIYPTVRIANYFQTALNDSWGIRIIEDWELILVVAGRFVYQAQDVEVKVEANQVLAIPPDEKHVFKKIDKGKGIISCIHGEMVQDGTWASGDYLLEPLPQRVTDVQDDPAISVLFKQCRDVFEGYGRYRVSLARTICREIWLRLAERWSGGEGRRRSKRTDEMIRFISKNLTGNISRKELAGQFSLTPEHVNAIFKKELGISPTQFIHRERVMLACRYMQHHGMNVKEAAARVGFYDQYYFSRIFKKILGFPPSKI